jgi:hypothetical protein
MMIGRLRRANGPRAFATIHVRGVLRAARAPDEPALVARPVKNVAIETGDVGRFYELPASTVRAPCDENWNMSPVVLWVHRPSLQGLSVSYLIKGAVFSG